MLRGDDECRSLGKGVALMRRIVFLLTLVAVLMLASALPALADAGGSPNQNACFGQEISSKGPPGQVGPELGFGPGAEGYMDFLKMFPC
jgi:hypothetical protein